VCVCVCVCRESRVVKPAAEHSAHVALAPLGEHGTGRHEAEEGAQGLGHQQHALHDIGSGDQSQPVIAGTVIRRRHC
jgi:hypothetical protein